MMLFYYISQPHIDCLLVRTPTHWKYKNQTVRLPKLGCGLLQATMDVLTMSLEAFQGNVGETPKT